MIERTGVKIKKPSIFPSFPTFAIFFICNLAIVILLSGCEFWDLSYKDSQGLMDGDQDKPICQSGQTGCDGTWTTSCQGGVWVRVSDCAISDKICVEGSCVHPADGDEESQADGDVESVDGDEESNPDGDLDSDLEDVDIDLDPDPDPEIDEEEQESGNDCASGPCCDNGHWVVEGGACVSGRDAFDCTSDTCDAAHACSVHTLMEDFCLIEEVCYDEFEDKPGFQCTWCDPINAPTGWTDKPETENCEDGEPCTYDDHCSGVGTCLTGTPITCGDDPGICSARRSCNGTSECTVTYADDQTACETDDLDCTDDTCDGEGNCDHIRQEEYCLIDNACHADGADEPGNECRYCDTVYSTSVWRNKSNGLGCGSFDQCVSGECLDCHNVSGCSDLSDDGLECSEPACVGNMCVHDLDAHDGELCGDDSDTECTDPDTCDAQGVCQLNHEPVTTSCNDGVACTHTDKCDGSGVCAGTLFSCNSHGSCNGTACDCDTDFGGTYCNQCASGYSCYPDCVNTFTCSGGICRDPATCFQWQQAPTGGTIMWGSAGTHCGSLDLSGTGWRLPNISELRSVVRGCGPIETGGACGVKDVCGPCGVGTACLLSSCHTSACNPPSCADAGSYWPAGLGGTGSWWSSSSTEDSPSTAWAVSFSLGLVGNYSIGNGYYVRCVRGGP